MMRTCTPTRSAGFTLIELMMALVIGAILLTIGVPSFQSFIVNQRVKTTAFEIVAALNYARSEAIKRNRSLTLDATDSGATWTLSVDDTELRSWSIPSKVTAVLADVTFNADGRSTAAATFTICDVDNSEGVLQRRVNLDLSGRANLTRGDSCG
jgi:type IV fimbrial biogenesis protein FimT